MDQLASEPGLHKVVPPEIFWVSRKNLFIEQGRDGRLEASIIGTPRTIVQTMVRQLALCPSQALLRLRQVIVGFIHTTMEFYQSGGCIASASKAGSDVIMMTSSAHTKRLNTPRPALTH
jgi:hypothetical protein